MTTLENIDLVVERERDAAVDSQNFQPAEPFVYNRETWFSDCADYILGDALTDDYIREQLISLFTNMPKDGYPSSDRSKIINTQCMAMYMMNIGGQIFENCIKNGLTREMLGDRT